MFGLYMNNFVQRELLGVLQNFCLTDFLNLVYSYLVKATYKQNL